MLFEVDFVDFDLLNRIVGVGPCHPQAKTGVVLLTQTCEQRTPAVVEVPSNHELTFFRGWSSRILGQF